MIGATGFENVSQVLKTDRSGPFTSMSDNRPSLASYFDSADPVSTNWYDQTTALSAQQLDTYVEIPGVNNDKAVWLPPGQKPENKPTNMEWHKKGSGPFTPNQWGYDAKKAAEALAKREQKKSTGQTTHKDGEKKKS